MRRRLAHRILAALWLLGSLWLALAPAYQSKVQAQQPTVSIPTVTGSPSGPIAIVNAGTEPQINVRSGPGVDYPIVGVLVQGQQVPAYGRSPGGDWVQIAYAGVPGGLAWVYAYLVSVPGDLAIVEPPSTPTPRVTPTIDPTLAAQFIIEIQPTRLPTYTAPPPIVIPTFTESEATSIASNVPMGFIIIGMAALGVFGLLISLLRGR